jgi:hypothetical protein
MKVARRKSPPAPQSLTLPITPVSLTERGEDGGSTIVLSFLCFSKLSDPSDKNARLMQGSVQDFVAIKIGESVDNRGHDMERRRFSCR